VAGRRSSAKILFIAGDRGGSQVNQLQIPREYHAIQGSLHACKHRELIALANPILGATRERLAEAYREQPTVVHFAGHGDSRSLSIIQDQGVLASDVPLDADQFIEVLAAMKENVRLCVLNACASLDLARRLVTEGVVDFAVAWPATVPDSAAIAFSRAFYGALGDGRSIREAVAVGRIACGTGNEPVLLPEDNSKAAVSIIEEGDEG
jgi:hypothetical protein